MIAIFLPNLGLGGAERVMLTLAEEFTRQGHKVDLVVLEKKGPLADSVPDGVNVVALNVPRLRNAVLPIRAYLKSRKPEGIVANIWPLTLVVALAARFAGRLNVVTVHQNNLDRQYGETGKVRRPVLKLAVQLEHRLASSVIGCSGGVVDALAQVSNIPATDFVLQENPVRIAPDLKPETLMEVEQKWRVPHGGRFLAVGNLKAQKNYDLMVRAFARIATPERQLIIIGEGEQRAQVEALRDELGLTSQIDLPGQSLTVEAFYRTADVYVMSSNYEGLPTVLVEALGSGLSIVSTDCPFGPVEILDQGRYGKLVAMNDEEALADAMEGTLLKPFDPESLRARAEGYAPGPTAQSYLKMLDIPSVVKSEAPTAASTAPSRGYENQ